MFRERHLFHLDFVHVFQSPLSPIFIFLSFYSSLVIHIGTSWFLLHIVPHIISTSTALSPHILNTFPHGRHRLSYVYNDSITRHF